MRTQPAFKFLSSKGVATAFRPAGPGQSRKVRLCTLVLGMLECGVGVLKVVPELCH